MGSKVGIQEAPYTQVELHCFRYLKISSLSDRGGILFVGVRI